MAVLAGYAAPASAKTERAALGNVNATFSFAGGGMRFSNLRLKISVGGSVFYNRRVHSRFCQRYCGPLETGTGQTAVRVLDMQSDGSPEVIVSLFTEGAHCCVVEQVYRLGAPGRGYRKAEHDFGNAGATLSDVAHDGRYAFVSADNAFFYRYTSYAASGAPVQIWTVKRNRFVNVTRRYPARIAADARRWWRMYVNNWRVGEGFIAAWAADEDMLGNAALVNQTLEAQAQQGHLRSDIAEAPTGYEFVNALEQFLQRRGYSR